MPKFGEQPVTSKDILEKLETTLGPRDLTPEEQLKIQADLDAKRAEERLAEKDVETFEKEHEAELMGVKKEFDEHIRHFKFSKEHRNAEGREKAKEDFADFFEQKLSHIFLGEGDPLEKYNAWAEWGKMLHYPNEISEAFRARIRKSSGKNQTKAA